MNHTRTGALRYVLLCFGLILGLSGCSSGQRPTLIVAALSQELAPLLSHLTDQREVALSSGTALSAMLEGQSVVIMTTGVGLVNAAAATQRGIDAFNPSEVLMVGVAGALDPSLALGAVVIPSGWINHQAGRLDADSFTSVTARYPADPVVLAIAQTLPGVVVGGVGVSGDVFVNDAAARDRLYTQFTAHVVDMESAAVAQVAAQNNLPFLSIRAVSDRAGGVAEGEIAQSMDAAVLAACTTLRGILKGL